MRQEHSIKTTSPLIAAVTVALAYDEHRLPPARPQNRTIKKPVDPRFAVPSPESNRVRGRDGRMVLIPAGFVAAQGRDGRVVAVPTGAGSLEGSDGRVVAIPSGHLGIENAKGRVVPKARY
jgi:hypothetical protein